MFCKNGRCHSRDIPQAPPPVNPPGVTMADCRMPDEWTRFYLSSAIIHPAPDDGVDTEHLAAFAPGSAANGATLRINSQGMRLADLSRAMRVAKEAEDFFAAIHAETGPAAETGGGSPPDNLCPGPPPACAPKPDEARRHGADARGSFFAETFPLLLFPRRAGGVAWLDAWTGEWDGLWDGAWSGARPGS